MKKFLFYEEFINEAEIPFNIEGLRLDKLKWNEDKDLQKSLSDKLGIENCRVFVTKDVEREREYKFETWENTLGFVIRIKENKKIIFDKVYHSDIKTYYDQDCEIVLGFKINIKKK
jgi:hypothetical protein